MLALLFSSMLCSPAALANGQSTHVWIAQHGVDHLPEGDLKEFVSDPAHTQALLNGAMFPDGGYAIGDHYGEMAHWEPLQNAYRDWIRTTHSPPWTDEASKHVAFLLGMAAHGIADQTFDALFMEHSKQEDAEGGWAENFDLATDVVMMAHVGPRTPPEHWVPARTLADIYSSAFDYDITKAQMDDAQELLRFAITSVGLFSEDPDLVAKYEAAFPWAAVHINDPDSPGSPPCESALLALYWQSVWERLHGDLGGPPEVLATFPKDGSYGHPRSAAQVQSRISLMFSEALHQDSLTDGHFVLEDDSGRTVPTDAWLFYRDMSNVVHLSLLEDLAEETWYTVHMSAGIAGIEGGQTESAELFRFTTAPPIPADTADSGRPVPSKTESKDGCDGCATRGFTAPPLGFMVMLLSIWTRRRV